MEVFNSLNSDLPADRVRYVNVNINGDIWIVSYESGSNDEYYLTKYDGQSWSIYNHENSILPQYSISSVVCENEDIIWITATNGLIKFDSGDWTLYDDYVPKAIAIDSENNKWIKTSNSLLFFDDITFELIGELGGNNIFIDVADVIWTFNYGGNNWGNSGEGLFSYDGQNIINYNMENSNLPSNDVFSFCIDNNGIKWSGINKLGLFKSNDDNWESISCSNSLIPSIQILSVSKDNYNKMWFGGGKFDAYLIPGIAIYDNNSWTRTRFPSFTMSEIGDIVFDQNNYAWLCAYDIGLIKYIDNDNWIVFEENNSVLNSNRIICGGRDNNGVLWIGLQPDNTGTGGGLLKIDQDNWSMLTSENSGLTNNNVNDIHIDAENNLWLVVGKRWENQELLYYNGDTWLSYNHTNSNLPQKYMTKVVSKGNDDVWLTSSYGLYNYDGDSWTLFNNINSILPYEFCHAIKISEDQTIWVGSGDYLVKIKNDDWSKVKINKSPDYNDNCYIIDIDIDDEDNIWLGTDGNGVFVYDEDGSSAVKEIVKANNQTLKISPNPIVNFTDIEFELEENTYGQFSIFNIAGEMVFSKLYSNLQKGKNSISLNVSDFNNGTYLLSISTEKIKINGKFIVQKR